MKPAAVYLRVSTNRQNPENQAPDCRKLCVSLGWAPKVFSEKASGAKDRAVWNEIMRRALRGEFCGVVVWSIDRMGRNFFDIQDAIRKLGDAKIPVASARESWVLELSESEPLRALLVAIMGFVADVERRRTMDRIQAGLATARRQGKTLGRPRVLKGDALDMAVRLRRIGGTWGEIANALAKAGHKAPGGGKFARGTVASAVEAAPPPEAEK